MNHFTDNSDLSLLGNDVIVGGDAKVVVDGVAEGHRNHGPDGFTVTIEVIPDVEKNQYESNPKNFNSFQF